MNSVNRVTLVKKEPKYGKLGTFLDKNVSERVELTGVLDVVELRIVDVGQGLGNLLLRLEQVGALVRQFQVGLGHVEQVLLDADQLHRLVLLVALEHCAVACVPKNVPFSRILSFFSFRGTLRLLFSLVLFQ